MGSCEVREVRSEASKWPESKCRAEWMAVLGRRRSRFWVSPATHSPQSNGSLTDNHPCPANGTRMFNRRRNGKDARGRDRSSVIWPRGEVYGTGRPPIPTRASVPAAIGVKRPLTLGPARRIPLVQIPHFREIANRAHFESWVGSTDMPGFSWGEQDRGN